MNQHQLFLYWVNVPFEAVLCALIYARGLQRRLPFFSAYATVFFVCTLALGFIYCRFGFQSAVSYYVGWIITGINIIGRSLAVVELARSALKSYRGIWELAWRALACLAGVLLLNAAADSWGQPNWVATYVLSIERDIGTSSVVILLAILLIGMYYGVRLGPMQKRIAVGILLLCAVDIVNDTVLKTIFSQLMFSWSQMRPQAEQANDWWNTARTAAFLVSLSIWCFAVRKPLPSSESAPELLPAEIYAELSPAVNLRLRSINDRLLELLKP